MKTFRIALVAMSVAHTPGSIQAQETSETYPRPNPVALTPRVREIVGLVPETTKSFNPRQRQRNVRRLATATLGETDVKAIQWFIMDNPEAPPEYRGYWSAVVNDMFTVLRAQTARRREIVGFLGKVSRFEKTDVEIRDYALQHLVDLYPSVRDDKTKGEILDRLGGAAAGDESLASTALLGWHRLMTGTAPEANVPDRARRMAAIRNQTLKTLAADGSRQTQATRATAIQVAVSLGLGEALPGIRRTAADPSAPVALRLASVNGIGRLQGEAGKPLLDALAADTANHRLVRNAAAGALRQIEKESK